MREREIYIYLVYGWTDHHHHIDYLPDPCTCTLSVSTSAREIKNKNKRKEKKRETDKILIFPPSLTLLTLINHTNQFPLCQIPLHLLMRLPNILPRKHLFHKNFQFPLCKHRQRMLHHGISQSALIGFISTA